jgi:hypothetical protein
VQVKAGATVVYGAKKYELKLDVLTFVRDVVDDARDR